MRIVLLLIALLALAAVCLAELDSLQTADSLREVQSRFPLWADSGLIKQDSLAGGQGAADRWLLPLGVILLSGTAAWLLFSVRSK
jgi:hypothetical protein